MNPPLCKDCKHIIPYETGTGYGDTRTRLATCAKSATIRSFVTGEERHRFCDNERESHGQCGPEGKLFERDDCDITP